MATGRLREDLYYRLNVIPMHLPRLIERREDIPVFVDFFLKRGAEVAGMPAPLLGGDALASLQAYTWPGNVRQLSNVIDWLFIMYGSDTEKAAEMVRADMLPPEISSDAPALLQMDKAAELMNKPLREAREMFERDYLMAQVHRFGGNISRTANFIGMERSALHRKLKSLGV